MLKKKIWAVIKELYNFLPQNLSLSSKKYGVGIRDPGSGTKTYSGSRIRVQGQKGTRSRIRNTACSGIEERVTQLDPLHLDVVTACLTESWQRALYPPT
jgi:hypothetical protein